MALVKRGVSVATEAISIWTSHNAFQHAGALAFYTLFSLAPMAIIVITIVGAVFGEEAARGEVASQIDDLIGPQAAAAVQEAVRRSRVEQAGLLPTVLGIGALMMGATTVFAQMQTSLNQFWGVTARPSRSGIVVFLMTRLVSLGVVLIIGFLLLTSLVMSMGILALIRYAESWIPIPALVVSAIDVGLSLATSTLLFAVIFKVLPDVRLQWRDVWRSAFMTAVLFVVGQYLISLYLTTTAPGSTYGAAGSLVVLLMWVYYSALILFLGTALTRATITHRGDDVVPKPTAVRVQIQILEDDGTGMKQVDAVD
ncbi:MAG TPA: YihY/virulence factor BrkB family protein [Vicinamibacterales bacterium]